MSVAETTGYLLGAGTGTMSSILGWVLQIDCAFYQREPFQAVTLLAPPPKVDDANRREQDSDISDLTDMDRLTQAIREIALRTVEKNPGPLLDSLI